MSKMAVVDELGRFLVDEGTLKVMESAHPVYKARIAIALDKGAWLHAPTKGHELAVYAQRRASVSKLEEFEKSAKLYLAPYGPEVVERMIRRGQLSFNLNITKETING